MASHPRADVSRTLLRAATPALGALWAGALVGLGLWFVAGPGAAPSSPERWIGVFLLASGQFVFMVVVADRLIPPRRPALAHALEGLAALIIVASALALAFALATRTIVE
jgi:hypothetical protein